MHLMNCDNYLILTWAPNCVISSATGSITFAITDTKLYIPVVTQSSQDDSKLLQQLKSGFKRAINWNKHKSKLSTKAQNRCLDYLIDPSF